jgi:hypothetical protein
MKNIFHYKSGKEILGVAFFLSMCLAWICYDGTNKKDDKLREEFSRNIATSFCVGILSSALVVFFGVKSVKQHVDDIKREDLHGLHEFWKNNLAPRSKQTPKYNIIIVLEKKHGIESQSSDLERLIGISKSFAYFHIHNTITDIYDKNVEINFQVLHDGDKIQENILQENLIFLGCGSTTSTITTICDKLDIRYFQRNRGNEENCFSIRNLDESTIHLSKIHGDTGFVSKDFGVVTRIATKQQLIIVYNANYSQGLLGGVIATTNPSHLRRTGFIESNHQLTHGCNAKDLIISVINKNNQIGPSDLNLDPNLEKLFKSFDLGSFKEKMNALIKTIKI